MSHSPEPWRTCPFGDLLLDATGESLHCKYDDGIHNPEDIRRIVTCVNACRGFSTEQLEAAAKGEAICMVGRSKELVEAIKNAPDAGMIEFGRRIAAMSRYCAGIPTEFLEKHAQVREKAE